MVRGFGIFPRSPRSSEGEPIITSNQHKALTNKGFAAGGAPVSVTGTPFGLRTRMTKGPCLHSKGPNRALLLCFVVVASVLLVHGPARAAQLSLTWDPSGDSDVAGYKIYYGTQSGAYTEVIDAGNSTTCTVPDLAVGTTYYIAATAYDSYGYESDYSNELDYAVTGDAAVNLANGSASGGGGGGGGGCFIATAAFGSYIEPHVMVLRSFRDSFLLTNRLGKAFVSCTMRPRPLMPTLYGKRPRQDGRAHRPVSPHRLRLSVSGDRNRARPAHNFSFSCDPRVRREAALGTILYGGLKRG